MENVWLTLPESPPYVLPADRDDKPNNKTPQCRFEYKDALVEFHPVYI